MSYETMGEGWSNAPTWRVNQWLVSDKALQNEVLGIVRAEIALVRTEGSKALEWSTGEALREWVEEILFPKHPRTLNHRTITSFSWIVRDLLKWACAQVNWRELAGGWITKCDELDAED